MRAAARAALSLAATAGVAEVAVRGLRPRGPELRPATIEPQAYFSPAVVRRARAYRRPQLLLGLAGTAVDVAVLAVLARRPDVLPVPPRVRRLVAARPVAGAGLAGAGLSVGLTAVGLPLGAVAHARARRVGLATQGFDGWLGDVGRALAVSAPLAAAGGAASVWALRRWPQRWWLPATGATVTLAAAAVGAGPVLIDPIFNRFEPLAPGPVRDGVLDLGRRAGVRLSSVLVMDASRRTRAVNAYVTGLGPTKRVVLYDTLLETFSPQATLLVVAHELGHVRRRDVQRGLVFLAASAPAALRAVQGLAGADGSAGPSALPGLVLALGAASAVILPASNRLSRAIERRADRFALELSQAPAGMVELERRLVEDNLADPAPPRWLAALLATHPPAVERVGSAVAWARSRGVELPPPPRSAALVSPGALAPPGRDPGLLPVRPGRASHPPADDHRIRGGS